MNRLFVAKVGDDTTSIIEDIKRYTTGDWKIAYLNNPLQQYLIPSYCNYEGRAIYLQSDYALRSNLHELLNDVPWDKFFWNPALAFRDEVVVVNCELSDTWWPNSNQIDESGWDSGQYVKYLMKHNAIRFGSYADWNWRTKPTDQTKLYLRNYA